MTFDDWTAERKIAGKIYRKARKLCKLSLNEVATKLNITVQNLSDFERGVGKGQLAYLENNLRTLYLENEKPPRFEGQRTVSQLLERNVGSVLE